MIDIYLQPGEYRVAGAGTRLHTLLGSCVSITLWHPQLRIGAMCHFLLAARPRGTRRELDARYAEEVMPLIVSELAHFGVSVSDCQAKLFGGGNMFQSLVHRGPSIGHRNGEAARELTLAYGIPVVSESLFGTGHRRIIFEIDSGAVWSRHVDRAQVPTLKESR